MESDLVFEETLKGGKSVFLKGFKFRIYRNYISVKSQITSTRYKCGFLM